MSQREKSFNQQKIILLVFTLSILAVAILLLNLRELVHHDLFKQVSNHQLIVFHVEKAKEELRAVEQNVLLQQLRYVGNAGNSELLDVLIPVGGFNYSNSFHALRKHVEELFLLQKETESHDSLSLKLERQLDELLAPDSRLEISEGADLDLLKIQIEGLILTMEQLEGVHSLQIKALTDHQSKVTRRDTIVMIIMVAILALLSYMSITSVMGQVQSMIEKQYILTRELESKNAELERFAYTISHDLKSPLVTIKNFVGMLEQNIRKNDRSKTYQDIEHISTAADNMAALLEGLLELSRIGHIVNPPQSGQLNSLVAQAVDKLRAEIDVRGVEFQIDAHMPDYWGDSLRLQEVFQNLIENAVKFMGDQAQPLIQINAKLEGGEVICMVSDNGIGIDPQYNSLVFDLFERLDTATEGSGIGLSLVKRIVEAHEGRIWIESNTDSPGCTVVFTLPVQLADT